MSLENVIAWIVIPMLTGAACVGIGVYFGNKIASLDERDRD